MRIVVILPNADWATSAGVRIRYRRIAPHLQTAGHRLDLVAIGDLAGHGAFDADVYLFCKCHDTRSVLLAAAMAASAVPPHVGIDIFDDYFSQTANARFTHMRDWLARIVPHLDFGLCATPAMRDVLAGLGPVRQAGLGFHVMNDPFGSLDPAALQRSLPARAAAARRDRALPIGWFGTGDNPDFPVGLQDLGAMGGMLADLTRTGHAVQLRILTNRRAMTDTRLAMLSRLPVPWTIEEWSEPREEALIASSLACFMPVNAQGFSVVKSLNRAVSALTGGAQVLSAGYPLYQPLAEFVYRDAHSLIADLQSDSLRLRTDTLPALARLLRTTGDPQAEAARLVAYLTGLPPRPKPGSQIGGQIGGPARAPVTAVVLGLRTAPDLAEGLRRMGHLVVANPFSPGKRVRDVVMTFQPGGGVAVWLSGRAAARLAAPLAAAAGPATDQGPEGDTGARALDLGPADWARPPGLGAPGPAAGTAPAPLAAQADYTRVMGQVAAVLAALFPGTPVQVAEQSAPFRWHGPPDRGAA